MTLPAVLRTNLPTVVSETFDDEVVVVNFKTGSYYSLDKEAAFIWTLLAQGCTEPQLCDQLAHHYEASYAEIESAVKPFLAELQARELVQTHTAEAGGAGLPHAAPPPDRDESFLAQSAAWTDRGHNLLTPAAALSDGSDGGVAQAAKGAVPGTAKPVFATPILHQYADMEELLLIDPIHEVDEMGWPSSPALRRE